MNFRLVIHYLSTVCFLIAAAMAFSLPWASPALSGTPEFERRGFMSLVVSIGVSLLCALALRLIGHKGEGHQLFRREAMAVVGLSWVLATLLGALPYAISGTARGLDAEGQPEPMNVSDWLFESQSGFSTTGATVLKDVENPQLVPRCILFWRSSTQFLGGLGIIVLFVAVLGQGSAGKALMRNEMPGPSKAGSQVRMQHTAWAFVAIYVVLIAVLAVLLLFGGLSLFDALCFSFATLATGGFSTYNASVGHFALHPELYDALWIETMILIFMILGGTNFTLLYFVAIGRGLRLLTDTEWRTYMAIIVAASLAIMIFGLLSDDFTPPSQAEVATGSPVAPQDPVKPPLPQRLGQAARYSTFQVVSILTTTGYATHDFNRWDHFSRGLLFLLMFVGGCAGSTAGGIKVIRHVMFVKILRLEVEQAYRPNVVRPLRIGGEPVEDRDLRKSILVYFCLVLTIFVFSWVFLITVEPDLTWETGREGSNVENKLIDSATAIAITLNNVGPGLGTIGATENFAHFSQPSKLLFVLLMMLGRLEIFPILVLMVPQFWRSY